ncbi:hypothetical protein [Stenotrophomonas sp. S39]|uniref:hypothetical protein n=1 Tax=Stenotrophomonas sp. S39 TaxID=2767451 RepID=UPI00190A2E24|nr:hypothetical protein [Stenotrophomonas sp. S39]MBK0053081.1 hypothetical protein [Stenotrophomonas sp. S39]
MAAQPTIASFLIAITSAVTSVGLAAVLVFLSKNWVLARLTESIRHEYDVRLESYRSQIGRRERAYEEIVNALYDKLAYYSVHKRDYGQGTGLSEERERQLLQTHMKASASLHRATDVGSLFISEEAVQLLVKLRNRRQLDFENEPAFEYFDSEYEEHKSALNALLKIAVRDLKRT